MGRFMNKGFTLIELLIVLVVSGIIMTGIYSAFKTQQDSYLAQEQVAEMQQNLRAGSLIMARELRMAGYDGASGTSHISCNLYGSGSPGTAVSPGIIATAASKIDFSMDLNSDGDCADTNENLSYYIYTAADGVDKLGRRDNNAATPTPQAVAENFENLEPVEQLEHILDEGMKVLKLDDQNLILVNGELSLGEFLGKAFQSKKIVELLQQES